MRIRKLLYGFGLLAALIVAVFLFAPWHALVQQKLIVALNEKGISPVSLTLDRIGLRGLELKDVSLGEPPLKLAHLTLAYSPRQLWNRSIEEVTLTGLTLAATRDANGWSLPGFDGLLRSNPEKPQTDAVRIPLSRRELAALPLRSITLTDSTLQASANAWKITAPVEWMLRNDGTPTMTLESTALTAAQGEDRLTIGKLKMALALDEAKQQWHGDWSIGNIAVTTEAATLPELQAVGKLTVTAETIELTGNLNSADKTHRAAFRIFYSLSKPETSRATIAQAAMPWGGGIVSVKNAIVPLFGKKATTLNLSVQQIAIDTLMQALTGNRATATGVVSGVVPVTVTADGQVRIGKGSLKAEAPGVIALSPEVIPGDNQQVALVREVLKNLHYTLLSLELEMAPDNTLSALLAVEGNNPDVERGRPVKLQVHLSGDLLNLITQNVKLMTDPKTFIRQETHDTP